MTAYRSSSSFCLGSIGTEYTVPEVSQKVNISLHGWADPVPERESSAAMLSTELPRSLLSFTGIEKVVLNWLRVAIQ